MTAQHDTTGAHRAVAGFSSYELDHQNHCEIPDKVSLADAPTLGAIGFARPSHQSDDLRRRAFESGGVGAWRWNTRSGLVEADETVERLWGMPHLNQPHPVSIYYPFMTADDCAATEAVGASDIAPGQVFQAAVAVAHGPRAGSWVQCRGRADRHQPWIIHGVTFDATEGRLAAQTPSAGEAQWRPSGQGRPLGTATDIEDLKAQQQRQAVLVGEFQHRTRNLIGLIRASAERTIARSRDFEDFRASFGDRLAALARVQNLLSPLAERGCVTFDDLLRSELTAVGGLERVHLDGPSGIALCPSTLQISALAFHELATNALKYGALAQADGRLDVRWRLEGSRPSDLPWLHVDWRESGVILAPRQDRPHGSGCGRELIERALPYQLGAKTTFSMEPDGVHCTIAMQVSRAPASS